MRPGQPSGVVSKSDLVIAYARGLSPEKPAGVIMNAPLVSCRSEDRLSDAVLKMLLTDMHHLFVVSADTGSVAGVISLSDAARFRSGTCRAYKISRTFSTT